MNCWHARSWLAQDDRVFTHIFMHGAGAARITSARRWRWFLATAGLFGHADGTEWGVSHYRLAGIS